MKYTEITGDEQLDNLKQRLKALEGEHFMAYMEAAELDAIKQDPMPEAAAKELVDMIGKKEVLIKSIERRITAVRQLIDGYPKLKESSGK